VNRFHSRHKLFPVQVFSGAHHSFHQNHGVHASLQTHKAERGVGTILFEVLSIEVDSRIIEAVAGRNHLLMMVPSASGPASWMNSSVPTKDTVKNRGLRIVTRLQHRRRKVTVPSMQERP
jgi:hypothetical protein